MSKKDKDAGKRKDERKTKNNDSNIKGIWFQYVRSLKYLIKENVIKASIQIHT